ncbi:hypothetical protein BDY17DRAFT_99457 [Neohortaea acidophila]|uniref:Uncharacterized protein n=1 Tax=Neohortaea acidophila TaxID=245834 RepID=A0A6A6Q0N8_9PEZI|nr:uncharacterized protein BDY17DRAFT_99457 [Neohortaea acidophila]KAF2485253.1 hypothetical protein BDY17DRAFT_99457 [Neohortaea acidophila]
MSWGDIPWPSQPSLKCPGLSSPNQTGGISHTGFPRPADMYVSTVGVLSFHSLGQVGASRTSRAKPFRSSGRSARGWASEFDVEMCASEFDRPGDIEMAVPPFSSARSYLKLDQSQASVNQSSNQPSITSPPNQPTNHHDPQSKRRLPHPQRLHQTQDDAQPLRQPERRVGRLRAARPLRRAAHGQRLRRPARPAVQRVPAQDGRGVHGGDDRAVGAADCGFSGGV